MKKIALILLDALTRESAVHTFGFLRSLVESGEAGYLEVTGDLPSLSRPCYESILTGTPSSVHHITANNMSVPSPVPSVFSLAHDAGLKTGAAAYHWISELYNRSPFNPFEDRITHDEQQNIQHGIFYFDDTYPDSHLFLDGAALCSRYVPDFMLFHPMGIDYVGHAYGSQSREYEKKCVEMDTILANAVPLLVSQGYGVIVTSDHGMSALGNHGGDQSMMRDVFAYFIHCGIPQEAAPVSQLCLAPTICTLLDILPAPTMKKPPICLD
ncbi:MAG: alkaline phosphatase family protein [Ethanoligenens sp.]